MRWGAHIGPSACVVNEETQHCWLLIPRCASTSLFLLPGYRHVETFEKPEGWTTSMPVRDPFERAASAVALLGGWRDDDPHFLPQTWFLREENPVDEFLLIEQIPAHRNASPARRLAAARRYLEPVRDELRVLYHQDYRLLPVD